MGPMVHRKHYFRNSIVTNMQRGGSKRIIDPRAHTSTMIHLIASTRSNPTGKVAFDR